MLFSAKTVFGKQPAARREKGVVYQPQILLPGKRRFSLSTSDPAGGVQVPGMQPSHAAALNAAGLGHPDLLLCASEGEVAAALAAGLPANMRKRKKQKDKQWVPNLESS